MAQYDVYANKGAAGYLMDIQSDLLNQLNTRVVVPLLPVSHAPTPLRRLNPIMIVSDANYVFASQFMAAIEISELDTPLANFADQHDTIRAALDMVFIGF
ncbi:MAG: CcdB family protein [Rhizobiaceae bacterium]